MDIKDELNEMLASFQSKSKDKPDSNNTNKAKNTIPADKMSVDDLINVLSASKPTPKKEPEVKKKNASTANIPSDLLNILNTGTMKRPIVPQKKSQSTATQTIHTPPVVKEALKAETVTKKEVTTEIPTVKEKITHTIAEEKKIEPVNNVEAPLQKKAEPDIPKIIKEAEEIKSAPTVIEEQVISNPILESEDTAAIFSPESKQNKEEEKTTVPPLKKKKKIVINHDLPDYEALRNEALGKSESIIEESIIVNEEVNAAEPIEEAPEITETPVQPEKIETNAEEAIQEENIAENNVFSSSEIEAEFLLEESMQKTGLFSKFRSAMNKKKKQIEEEQSEEKEITADEEAQITEEPPQEENVIPADETNTTLEEIPLEFDYEHVDEIPTNELIDAVLGKDNGITDSVSEPTDIQQEENTESNPVSSGITDNSYTDISEAVQSETESETEEKASEEININIEPPKAKNPVIAFLENVLNENPEEISDIKKSKSEADDIDISVSGKSKFKKHFYSVIGVLLFVFAVIGFTFSVGEGIKFAQKFTSGEDKKSEYINTVYPAVIMDIDAFSSPSELSSEQIINASVWSFVISDDIEKYEHTLDMVSVPAVDIEKYATDLFGSDIPQIEHKTVGSGDVKFYYNADSKSYNIPVNPVIFSYKPYISAISKNGDIHTVEVKYIQETPSWMSEKTKYTEVYAKVTKFKLRKTENGYNINSVEVISINSVN